MLIGCVTGDVDRVCREALTDFFVSMTKHVCRQTLSILERRGRKRRKKICKKVCWDMKWVIT